MMLISKHLVKILSEYLLVESLKSDSLPVALPLLMLNVIRKDVNCQHFPFEWNENNFSCFSFNDRGNQRNPQNSYTPKNGPIDIDSYDPEDILYLDRFGKAIDVFIDENGIVYAPIHRVTGVRKAVKKNSRIAQDYLQNPDNFVIIDNENNSNLNQSQTNLDSYKSTESLNRSDRQRNDNKKRQDRPTQNHSRNAQNRPQRYNQYEQRGQNHDQTVEEDDWAEQTSKTEQKTTPKSTETPRSFNTPKTSSESPKSFNTPKTSNPKSFEAPKSFETKSSPPKSILKNKNLQYEIIALPPGKTSVTIYNLDDNEIWVQPESEMSLAAEISIKAAEEVAEAKTISNPSIGTSCLRQFDGVWCRAIVTNVNPLTIRYVDFGNKETNPQNLHEISEELCKIPAVSIQIVFKGKKPQLQIEEMIEIDIIEKNNDIYYVKNVGEILETVISNSSISVIEKPEKVVKTVDTNAPPSKSVQKGSLCPKELMIFGRLCVGDEGLLPIANILAPGKFVGGIMTSAVTDDLVTLESLAKKQPTEKTLK